MWTGHFELICLWNISLSNGRTKWPFQWIIINCTAQTAYNPWQAENRPCTRALIGNINNSVTNVCVKLSITMTRWHCRDGVSELSRGDGCLTGGKRACDLTVNHKKALLTHWRGRRGSQNDEIGAARRLFSNRHCKWTRFIYRLRAKPLIASTGCTFARDAGDLTWCTVNWDWAS